MKFKSRFLLRNRYLFTIDLLLTVAAALGAFFLRLEGVLFYYYLNNMYWLIGVSLVIKPMVYYLFGLYRHQWAYASTSELKLLTAAVTTASGIVSLSMVSLWVSGFIHPGFVRTALVIDWLLSLIAIGGFRLALRLLSETRPSGMVHPGIARNVLVIGAGDAGALVVRELQKNPQLGLLPIGFLDDDPEKQRHRIHGIQVIGKLTDLGRTLANRNIDEVIIAIPSAGGKLVRMVADVCRLRNVPFRNMPGLYELIGGQVSVNRLREVDIADLLRREPAEVHNELIGATLTGKRVLVTGAGGSIGREICTQIARWRPSILILVGHGENSIFDAILELHADYPALPVQPVIADIRDLPRMQQIFGNYRPEVIFHAAAHKHVPLMESNVEEAVTNNVIGTRNVVQAADQAGTERLVMISTDKAVRPVNVMGATKRLAEMIVLDMAQSTGRAYSVVRFGNVLGSRGSVVPRFKHQIAQGGPVTITHPDMKRYFMTIPEASHLVLQAASMGKGGEVFLLNMGQQVRIVDLAEDLIRLSGLEPGKDIEISFTGIRPGEKLSEDLWEDGTVYQKTAHPEVFRLEADEANVPANLKQTVDELQRLATAGEAAAVLSLLDETIPEGHVRDNPTPDLAAIV